MARTIFTRANVFDGENPARPDSTVVVEGDRIVSVGSEAVVAQGGDDAFDLAGRTLMPGLGTSHLHAEFKHIDLTVQDEIFFGSKWPAGVQMAVAVNTCRTLMESGFTMAITGACSNNIDASLKIAIAEGLISGPCLLAGSRHIETTGAEKDRRVFPREEDRP
jgi:imidazolonepropionase-like amidohydrolase